VLCFLEVPAAPRKEQQGRRRSGFFHGRGTRRLIRVWPSRLHAAPPAGVFRPSPLNGENRSPQLSFINRGKNRAFQFAERITLVTRRSWLEGLTPGV
jgi:hypothetical protein